MQAYQEVQDMPKVQAFTESPAWPSRRGKLHSAGRRVSSRQSEFVFACAGQWKEISMIDTHRTTCILVYVTTQTQVSYMHRTTA